MSTFERLPAGIRDRDTADRDRLAGLALSSCKPGADELGEHWALEAVDVHDCFGGTERIAGEQSGVLGAVRRRDDVFAASR